MTNLLLPGGNPDRIALIEAATERTVRHGELVDLVQAEADRDLSGRLVFLAARSTVDVVVQFLALSASGATVALLDPATSPAILETWNAAYEPDEIIGFDDTALPRRHTTSVVRNEQTDAVLLSTSGSTGSPKFVRLSMENVVSNADQIREALRIRDDHRGFAHLPLFYSYGLSILTSHLRAGGSVVLTDASAIRPEFWDQLRKFEATSLPGVPYNFEMYRRMRLLEQDLPALRDVTQAGGRLNPERAAGFASGLAERGVRFWIMYGQTEATARICVLPSTEASDAIGSVGRPLPGGHISIDEPDADGVGEVLYSGPNVMLGYAERRTDLHSGDQVGGTLRTGDLGRLDDDGRLWITGRTKRIAKVFGTRMNLDDIERRLTTATGHVLAAVPGEDRIELHVEIGEIPSDLVRSCERVLDLSPRSIRAHAIDRLPTTAAGKVDYQQLRNSD